jgi:all-trans-8'-apo-beta-carotenal 15,15'-oxygenase
MVRHHSDTAAIPPSEMRDIVERAYRDPAVEVADPVALDLLEGTVPAGLAGVVLRNGPGRQERGGVRYGHPFDGDGFLQRFHFAGGQVRYTARYVRTEEWKREETAGRILYRGFGTNRPGGLLRNAAVLHFKNAANTSVVQHAGHTLALWEGGQPHAFEPVSLETHGLYDYDGGLANPFGRIDAWLNPRLPFSAHPSICPDTGELWNFGTAYGRKNRLLVYKVTPDGVLHRRDIEMDGLPFVHDFALTRRYAIFVLPAVRFDVARSLLGLKTPVSSLSLDDAPGTALLVPRDGGAPIRIPVEPGFVFHWANAWEEGRTIVLDGVKYQGFPELDDFDSVFAEDADGALVAHLVRLTLDLDGGTATEVRRMDHPMELPTRRGEGRDAVVYGTAAPVGRMHPFLSGLIRVAPDDTPLYRDFGRCLPSEPLPFGDWMVTQAAVWTDTGVHSELWLLDPDTLERIARWKLPHLVPPPLHGTVLSPDP